MIILLIRGQAPWCIALALGTTSLLAQAPIAQAPVQELTLKSAIGIALRQNFRELLARFQVLASAQESKVSLSRLLPHASLEAHQQDERYNIQVPFATRLPDVPQHIGPYQTTIAGPQFSAAVFDLALWYRYLASRREQRASRAEELATREDVAMLVVSQYLGCLRARAAQTASESRVRLARELSSQADDLLENGVGTSIDALRAKVQLQDEEQQLINAETAAKTGLYALAQILNLDPREEIRLSDELGFSSTPAIAEEAALERGFSERPELKALASRLAAARRLEQAARAERLPSLNFSGDWSEAGRRWNTTIPAWTFRGTFSVPLFTGGQIHAEIGISAIQVRRLEEQIRAERTVIAQQVKTSLAQLLAARHEIDVANSRVHLAEEEIVEARHRFEAGVANNLEVTSAQDTLARANDSQIAALLRYNQARADLFRATGQLEQMYAK